MNETVCLGCRLALYVGETLFTMAPTIVGPWSCGHLVGGSLTDLHFIEQTRTNMSQPGQRPGTPVGDEWHVLQALWSR